MALNWGLISNLESSLQDFLTTQATNDNVNVDIRVGKKFDTNWSLPSIQIYVDSKQKPRLEIGSNKRRNSYLMIIDIRATNNLERMNLADWLETIINDGFIYYEYSSNVSNPENPNTTEAGYVSFDYTSSEKVELGEDVNQYDLWRYRISINAWIIER